MRCLLGLLLLAASPAFAQVAIEKPWARATAPGATVAAGYLVVQNKAGAGDRLVAASSPAAARVELHEHRHEAGVMKMREVPGYDIPLRGAFELKPGGAHLMFFEIKRAFKEGDKVPVTLKFEKAGDVSAELLVRPLTAGAKAAHKH